MKLGNTRISTNSAGTADHISIVENGGLSFSFESFVLSAFFTSQLTRFLRMREKKSVQNKDKDCRLIVKSVLNDKEEDGGMRNTYFQKLVKTSKLRICLVQLGNQFMQTKVIHDGRDGLVCDGHHTDDIKFHFMNHHGKVIGSNVGRSADQNFLFVPPDEMVEDSRRSP